MAARQANMTPTRLRHALRAMRWPPRTLATALNVKEDLIEAWLDGTNRIPGNVAAWLETLALVHEAHPKPEDQRGDPMSEGEPQSTRLGTAARVAFERKPARRGEA